MEDGNPAGEARGEAPQRLRCERDLRDEHDRTEPARKRLLAGPQVHLGLAAPGCAVEQERAATLQRADNLVESRLLFLREGLGSRLGRERLRAFATLGALAARRRVWRNERQGARGSRPVVVGEPEREIDESRRDRPEHTLDRDRLDLWRSLVLEPDDDSAPPRLPERNGDDGPFLEPVGKVGERPRKGARGHEWIDRGEAGHQ